MKPRLWVRRRFEGADWERLGAAFEIEIMDGPLTPRIEAGGATDVVALWTFGERIDDALLDRIPAVRVIANHGVGIDTIDTEAIARHGVELVVPRSPQPRPDEGVARDDAMPEGE